jgi:hypothetical protein
MQEITKHQSLGEVQPQQRPKSNNPPQVPTNQPEQLLDDDADCPAYQYVLLLVHQPLKQTNHQSTANHPT